MKKKKHGKIVFLVTTELNSIEALICRALIDSYISHVEFVSVINSLREYDDMKKEIKNPKASRVHQNFLFVYKTMLSYCLKC